MHVSVAIANQHFQDINPRICGWETCEPSHKYGPAVRNYWLIHYIMDGAGVFRKGDAEYRLCASQMFVIGPGDLTYYEADAERPWRYIWIGFECSTDIAQILAEPVITLPQGKPLFEALQKAEGMSAGKEAYLCAKIWELLYLISSDQKHVGRKELYIQQAKNFMESEYMVGITVCEVAARLGLDRSYFSGLFRASQGKTPQQYLNEVRMRQAATLLAGLGYSVTETAALVGYADVFAFSRTFKKFYGISPSECRNRTNS